MLTLFDQDRVTEIYGIEKMAEGEAKGRINTVREMIKDGLTSFEAVKKSGRYTDQELAAIASL